MTKKLFSVVILIIFITLGGQAKSELSDNQEIRREQLKEEKAQAKAIEIELLERTAAEMKQLKIQDGDYHKQQKKIALSPVVSKFLKKHVHKDAYIHESSSFGLYYPISAETAMLWAIRHLEYKGAKKIEICELHQWFAGTGAFIIKGKFQYRDYLEGLEGYQNYSLFAIAILDGSEGNIGAEYGFVAKGIDDKGKTVWYPPPGPDSPDVGLAYDILDPSREAFESIPQRFK